MDNKKSKELKEEKHIDLLLKRYGFIREEINQSFRNQQNIINWSVVAFGVMFLFIANFWNISPTVTFGFLLIAIPGACITFLSVYISEVIRLMRSGHYLFLLERELESNLQELESVQNNIGWFEHWIREKDSTGKTRQTTVGYKSVIITYLGMIIFAHLICIFMVWRKAEFQSIYIKYFIDMIKIEFYYFKIIFTIIIAFLDFSLILLFYKKVKEDIVKKHGFINDNYSKK